MDINTLARSVVDQATGEKPVKKPASVKAVARGKKRMAALGAEELRQHQQNAANKRWHPAVKGVK